MEATSRASDEAIAAQIIEVVLARVAKGDIPLPSIPRVAMRAFELLGNDDFCLAEVAAIIESDPLVAARLVRLANSAAFARFTAVDTVPACINRLGSRELRFFLMETASRQLIECHDPRIAHLCDGLWKHSLSVAILAHDIGERVANVDVEAAYLAGLLHDIGRPVVAGMLLEAERRLLGKQVDHWLPPSKWLGLIMTCERDVGLVVTRACHLPRAVVEAVADCRYFADDRPRSLANLLRLADVVSASDGSDPTRAADEEMLHRIREGCGLLGVTLHDVVTLTLRLPQRLAARMV